MTASPPPDDTSDATRYFYELTPDRILDAVETSGVACTGRCMALNSMENRVYDVEIETDPDVAPDTLTPSERFRVVKFYRPGRWSAEQILEEHDFLEDLVEEEIPVVPPEQNEDGETLHELEDLGIYFSIFPRIGGRAPDELSEDRLAQLGRLLARVHNVGAWHEAEHRIELNTETYGMGNLEFLLESGALPDSIRERYAATVTQICEMSAPWFEGVPIQRLHGDCHQANVLWGAEGAFLVDFDDMVRGPCVQDLWLLAPGRDPEEVRRRNCLIEGYEEMRDFDHATLRLVEPLRALRIIHFAAWIARRWSDPAFPRVFPDFGTERYWFEQVSALTEQLGLIQEQAWG